MQVHTSTVDCCIVGGGPGGAVLALLLARQGVSVMLLEAHQDFERDFRGDTVHPSTLELLDDLGLYERLLELPHATFFDFPTHFPDGSVAAPTPLRAGSRHPRIMDVPQARLIDLLVSEAQRYPTFQLRLGARAEGLLEEDGVIRGVRFRSADGWHTLRATLVVAADGRFSRIRHLAGVRPIETSPPIDVLWFRLPRAPSDPEGVIGRFGRGHILILLDRGAVWQLGYVLPKGSYAALHAAGLVALRHTVAQLVPWLADRTDQLADWKQVALLSVASDRLPRWYQPGLLFIGDAAHVMSPVGGNGINYAVQDAVAAANLLAGPLQAGRLCLRDLAAVQRRRDWPTRLTQLAVTQIQNQVLAPALRSESRAFDVLRLILRVPLVRDLPPRLLAFGVRPEHVRVTSAPPLQTLSPGGER
jgi:2-polyprenyl-6-methoxyphenol hydroxylase-like FAD-dependent oxidoreductase